MINVPNKQVLDNLPSIPAEGEYALVADTKTIYVYNEKEWKPINIQGEGLQVSLYEINKNIFSQLKPMTDEALRQVHAQVFKFMGDTMRYDTEDYWALICWEKHYVTIFHHKNELRGYSEAEELSDIFMEIIEGLGEVKDVTESNNGALEIWITDEEDTNCYVFFNYRDGVVEGIA